MASPFSMFRKRQKLAMAFLCLLAMISFVILPYLQDLIGGGQQGAKNPVAVKTSKYGNLYESDINRLRADRQKVLAVLGELGMVAGGNPQLVEWRLQREFGPPTEESVVNSWLLARRAETLGMVVGDKTINAFLKEWTGNKVTQEGFQKAFKQSPEVSAEHFFDLMRQELLGRQLRATFDCSLRAITPGQRWDYFNRVNRVATIEAIPVAVADYIKQVKDPTEEELKEFFEKHKDDILSPMSPAPGFRKPQQVAIEYFKAEFDKFSSPAAVSDAEVKERYEKNKKSYDEAFKSLAEEKDVKKEGDQKTPAKDAKDAKDTKEATATDKAAEAKTPDDVKTDVKQETKEPAKETPKEEKKEPAKKDDAKGSSAVGNSTPFRLASMLQDAKPDEKKDETAGEKKDEKKAATPEAKPAAEPVKETGKPDAAKTAEKSPDAAKNPDAPKDGLTDKIKESIRQEIAIEKIQKVFDRLREPMEKYRRERSIYDADVIRSKTSKDGKPLSAPPAALDFEKLAKENGLTVGRTDKVSQWDMRDMELAGSRVEGRLPVLQYAFEGLSKWRAAVSSDAKAVYLFWKSDEEKEHSPKFTDEGVREEVLRQWKLIQARDLAMKQAEKWAGEAKNNPDKTLKQIFADRPDARVARPTPFTWITLGNVASNMMPRAEISTVSGVEMAGDDFMRTVFRLKPGEAGAAFNAPQTVVYVVRPSQFSPDHKTRWQDFQKEPFGRYASAGQDDWMRTARAWLEEIQKDAGFEWAAGRKPDRYEDRERQE